jgi:hypothetical protein
MIKIVIITLLLIGMSVGQLVVQNSELPPLEAPLFGSYLASPNFNSEATIITNATLVFEKQYPLEESARCQPPMAPIENAIYIIGEYDVLTCYPEFMNANANAAGYVGMFVLSPWTQTGREAVSTWRVNNAEIPMYEVNDAILTEMPDDASTFLRADITPTPVNRYASVIFPWSVAFAVFFIVASIIRALLCFAILQYSSKASNPVPIRIIAIWQLVASIAQFIYGFDPHGSFHFLPGPVEESMTDFTQLVSLHTTYILLYIFNNLLVQVNLKKPKFIAIITFLILYSSFQSFLLFASVFRLPGQQRILYVSAFMWIVLQLFGFYHLVRSQKVVIDLISERDEDGNVERNSRARRIAKVMYLSSFLVLIGVIFALLYAFALVRNRADLRSIFLNMSGVIAEMTGFVQMLGFQRAGICGYFEATSTASGKSSSRPVRASSA